MRRPSVAVTHRLDDYGRSVGAIPTATAAIIADIRQELRVDLAVARGDVDPSIDEIVAKEGFEDTLERLEVRDGLREFALSCSQDRVDRPNDLDVAALVCDGTYFSQIGLVEAPHCHRSEQRRVGKE